MDLKKNSSDCNILSRFSFLPLKNFSQERKISEDELIDKISGFWIGQLTGNYLGLPFENRYVEEPIPILIDRIYTYKDDANLKINRQDWRGHLPIMIDAFWGAFADDDTDIEFVTLHAVEQYGLDLNYRNHYRNGKSISIVKYGLLIERQETYG